MADTSKYTAYKNKFQAEKYDRIALQVIKGKKDTIKAHAESKGKSLNAYINDLIDTDIEKAGN